MGAPSGSRRPLPLGEYAEDGGAPWGPWGPWGPPGGPPGGPEGGPPESGGGPWESWEPEDGLEGGAAMAPKGAEEGAIELLLD